MYDGEDVGVYDVFDTIDIQLASTITDELEPITVEWSLVNFDGGSASIQMHIEKLYEQDIPIELYDDLQISFNDAKDVLKSDSGKGISFGEEISWKLQPLMDAEKETELEYLASLWLSLTWITLLISFFLAIFKGPLVMTWLFINSL